MITILNVAKSVRLRLKKEEEAFYQENIDRMLTWFDAIYKVNSEEYVYSTVSEEGTRNYFNDEIEKKEGIKEVLSNAASIMEDFIIVPKVI